MVLAQLEVSPGGATLEPAQVAGIRLHCKPRGRVYVPADEGVGSDCLKASHRITMKTFPSGDRKVEWDLRPDRPGRPLQDSGWTGYTIFVKGASRV